MNISIALPVLAPQPTGHPASLPPDPTTSTSTQQIQPPNQGAASSDANPRRHGEEEGHNSAPPSAIQIKIMEILEQQAEELKKAETDY